MHGSGEWAAVGTAICWSANSVFFTLAGRRVGSKTVNLARLWMALIGMLVLHSLLWLTETALGLGFMWLTGLNWQKIGLHQSGDRNTQSILCTEERQNN